MKKRHCPLCRGAMQRGHTDLTLRRGRSVVVLEQVPATVCENCGEAVLSSTVASKAYAQVEREVARGVALEFCKYAA